MKGILIVDAGASKSDWSLLTEKAEPLRLNTCGINPAHDSIETIFSQFRDVSKQLSEYPIEAIHFFGAGCASSDLKNKIKLALLKNFNSNIINVNPDIKAAAIALFGNNTGIACILGTGSATALFRNGKTINKIPSLGFILGDEGSGFALGKRLLNGIYKQTLSPIIIDSFMNEYGLKLETLIKKIYSEPKPTTFIASFAPFLLKFKNHQDIENLITEEFDSFFEKNIIPYHPDADLEIGMVGSVAFNFREFIQKSAKNKGIDITKIVDKPMPYLEQYFINNEK